MNEREALIAIRDRAMSLHEAVRFAREGLGEAAKPLDLDEPIADVAPEPPTDTESATRTSAPPVECTCRRKTIQSEQHAHDCPVFLGRHG